MKEAFETITQSNGMRLPQWRRYPSEGSETNQPDLSIESRAGYDFWDVIT